MIFRAANLLDFLLLLYILSLGYPHGEKHGYHEEEVWQEKSFKA